MMFEIDCNLASGAVLLRTERSREALQEMAATLQATAPLLETLVGMAAGAEGVHVEMRLDGRGCPGRTVSEQIESLACRLTYGGLAVVDDDARGEA